MNTNFSILFYLKKPKNYVSGPVPIYLRITVKGQRAELSTSRECDPSKWNSHSGRVNGTKEDAKTLNRYLDLLKHDVQNAQQTLVEKRQTVTAESLKNQFTGKLETDRYLLKLMEEHNVQIETLIGNGFEANTLKSYRTSEKHLKAYVKKEYGKNDIEINELDYAFINGYEYYLKTDCKISAASAAKYIKQLKKIVNHCLANSWLTENPFIKYKQVVKIKERTFLTQHELDAIATCKKFKVERLLHVRDVFVFCCYTGLSYADVKKLKRSEIGIGIDGEKWIFTSRQKTDTPSRIPLLPAAMEIINHYQDHPQCDVQDLLLPVLSNQKMNAYLKEIADLSDVPKNLTFHLARHTFATTVTLSNNVPIETVSKMLGHTNIKTTQHYAKVLDLKVSNDMASLKQKYRNA